VKKLFIGIKNGAPVFAREVSRNYVNVPKEILSDGRKIFSKLEYVSRYDNGCLIGMFEITGVNEITESLYHKIISDHRNGTTNNRI